MSKTATDSCPVAAAEILFVACPGDASMNRVPLANLDRNPKCGKCHNLSSLATRQKSDLPIVVDFWAE